MIDIEEKRSIHVFSPAHTQTIENSADSVWPISVPILSNLFAKATICFLIYCVYLRKHLSTGFAPPSGLEIPYGKPEFASIGPLTPLSQISGDTYSEFETCLDLWHLCGNCAFCSYSSFYVLIYIWQSSDSPLDHLCHCVIVCSRQSWGVMLSYIFQCRSETSIKAQTRVFTYMMKSTKSISA